MSQYSKVSMSRIDARTPLAVRDTIDQAAALQGRTHTDFLIEAALEKAERVIAEQTLIRLTLRDHSAQFFPVTDSRHACPLSVEFGLCHTV